MGAPLVTVIVPTHDHPTTLDLAVGSVLAQSMRELDVVIIGDGVKDDTREVVRTLCADARVRFLDRPKSPSRAEEARHEVLLAATAPFVCYAGDDDLLLPDHVATMLGLLERADFAHPLPMMVRTDGSLEPHPTDLSRPECITWHLHPRRNCISLTGAAHRVDAYRKLPHGWRAAPEGRWSDHYMWEQWFRTPGFRYATGERLTVLKLHSTQRGAMSPDERRRELLQWKARSEQPGFAGELAAMAADAWRLSAIQWQLELSAREDVAASRRAEAGRAQDELMAKLRAAERERDVSKAEAAALTESLLAAAALHAEALQRAEAAHNRASAAFAAELTERDAQLASARSAEREHQTALDFARAALRAAEREREDARAVLASTRATITWRLRDGLLRLPTVQRLHALSIRLREP